MHTHVANLLFAGMFAAIGTSHMGFGTAQIHAGQTLAWVAVPHAVTETAISMQADAAGTKPDGTAKIGQGKLQGDIGNLIALIKVFVPMIYGQAMAWGARNNMPGATPRAPKTNTPAWVICMSWCNLTLSAGGSAQARRSSRPAVGG